MKSHMKIAGALVLILSGCAFSKAPLADTEKSAADDQLLGTWVEKDGADGTLYTIERVTANDRHKSPMQIRETNFDVEKGKIETRVAPLYPKRIEQAKYASIEIPDDIKSTFKTNFSYSIVKYEVPGNTLSIWSMDDEEVAKGIKRGDITGHVDGRYSFVDDTPKNLTKYLATADDKSLFPDSCKRSLRKQGKLVTRFKFRYSEEESSLWVEMVDCANDPFPPDAKVCKVKGLPVELLSNPAREKFEDWWQNFKGGHAFSKDQLPHVRLLEWAYVEILDVPK